VADLGKTNEPQRPAARTMAQGRCRIAKARVDRLLTTEAAAHRTQQGLSNGSKRQTALVLTTRFFNDKSP
jgi:hypothetical protein